MITNLEKCPQDYHQLDEELFAVLSSRLLKKSCLSINGKSHIVDVSI